MSKKITSVLGLISILILAMAVGWGTNFKSKLVIKGLPNSTSVLNEENIQRQIFDREEKLKKEFDFWKKYKNKQDGFSVRYPQDWILTERYFSKKESKTGMASRFVEFSSPSGSYLNLGLRRKGTAMVDTGDVQTGRGLGKFVPIGKINLAGRSAHFYFLLDQNGLVSTGFFGFNPTEAKPSFFEMNDFEIHAFFSFAEAQKPSQVRNQAEFARAVMILESLKFSD